MSSEQRSSSAVRNLRSLFENKSPDTPDSRGRSPGSLADLDTHRPRSKIRSSFIPVQPTMAALAAEQNAVGSDLTRESSTAGRRASFSESQGGDASDAAKDTVNAEHIRRENDSSVAEAIPEAAIESATPTPIIEAVKTLGGKADKQAENPDKHVTGAEEEPADMKPADPTDEAAVSGGDALPPVAEDLRKPASKATSSRGGAKPSSISTKTAPKAPSSSLKSPASQPKTPASSTSSQKAPTKKASRSSLTAPTAASVARAAAADKAGATKQASPVSKPKPREVTKPLDVSSRLTAPTAASRARLESASSATATTTSKPTSTTASRPKTTASARPTPRQSLARPDSRSSQTSGKRPAAPVDGNFLERMTRPTAASANRMAEKTEVKSLPKQKQMPIRPKTNGQPKAPKTATTAAVEPAPELNDETEIDVRPEAEAEPEPTAAPVVEEESFLPEYHDHPPSKAAEAEVKTTPVPHTNGLHEDTPALESTPAGLEEDRIR